MKGKNKCCVNCRVEGSRAPSGNAASHPESKGPGVGTWGMFGRETRAVGAGTGSPAGDPSD